MIQKVYAGQSMLQQFPKRIVEQPELKKKEKKEETKSFSEILKESDGKGGNFSAYV